MVTRANKTASILLAIWMILLASCNAGELNKKAEITANDFYKDLQQKKFDSALNLCSEQAFTKDSKAKWTKVFESNNGLLGDLKSFTKTSDFNIATSTSTGTTVTVTYDLEWQYGKSKDSIMMVKEKDGSMKISAYKWKHIAANYLTEIEESEKGTSKYMDAVKAGDLTAATDLCSENAFKITSKINWGVFLDNAANKLGKVESYTILKDSSVYHVKSKGDAGEGNYYDVVVQSQRGGNKVLEKIVFYQKDYNEPVKVTGHFFQ